MQHIIKSINNLKNQGVILESEVKASFLEINFIGQTGKKEKLIDMLKKKTTGSESEKVQSSVPVKLFTDPATGGNRVSDDC